MSNGLFKGNDCYFVPPNNKYNLNLGDIVNLTLDDFSFATRISINPDEMQKVWDTTNQIEYAIINKNGLHCGISITKAFNDGFAGYHTKGTIWVHDGNGGHKSVSILSQDIFGTSENDNTIDIGFSYNKNEKYISLFYTNNYKRQYFTEDIIDYTNSYTWIGTSNPLDDCPPEFRNFFHGEIHFGGIYESCLNETQFESIFNNIENIDLELKPICVFDFKKETPYKVLDMSYNGNSIIKYDRELYNF
jgi:hypothetical protein